MIVLLFIVAAGLGTALRFGAGLALPRPLGTLTVNLVGAFVLGALSGAGSDTDLLVGVAGLGALTTFSTLVHELVDLTETHRRHAVAYLAVTIVGGVGAAWFGLQLA